MELAKFLVEAPPGAERVVEAESRTRDGNGTQVVLPSPIRLLCGRCGGERNFNFEHGKSRVRSRRRLETFPEIHQLIEEPLKFVWARNSRDEAEITIADYWCRDCREYAKQFAIVLWLDEHEVLEKEVIRAFKLTEFPPFGERLPNRLLDLMSGESRELMLKGKSNLNAGKGIGAFAYYRRVVEEEKDALFDEAIRTAKQRDDVTPEELERLEAAKGDFRFSRSIGKLGDFFPEHLKFQGQNPLALLHGAMSRDIHSGTDEESLDAARAVEQVLGMYVQGLADRRREADEQREAVKLLQDHRSEDK